MQSVVNMMSVCESRISSNSDFYTWYEPQKSDSFLYLMVAKLVIFSAILVS